MIDFSDKNILVIGDIMLDEYIEGNVTRLSPESPTPILNKTKHYYRLGGASNVAKNVSSLGANIWMMGRIGKDKNGTIIIDLLSKEKINIELLLRDINIPTITKTRFVTENQQLLRVDKEDKTSIENNSILCDVLLEDLNRHLSFFDAIIISDYDKGMIYPDLLKLLSNFTKEFNKIIVADTHKTNIYPFSGFTCITPNKLELSKMVGKPIVNLEDVIYNGKNLRNKYNLDNILITMSEEGIFYADKNSSGYYSAIQNNIIDVTGTGDTVVALYTLALISGHSVAESAKLANIGAGIVVMKMGTSVITIDELNKELDKNK